MSAHDFDTQSGRGGSSGDHDGGEDDDESREEEGDEQEEEGDPTRGLTSSEKMARSAWF